LNPDRPTDRAFVDTPVGDRNAAMVAAASAADQFHLGAPQLLRFSMNALFRCDDVVLRVSRPSTDASAALALAHWLVDHGVPTVLPAADFVVQVDDLAVTAWHYLQPSDLALDWHRVGQIIHHLHTLNCADLPAGYPLPRPTAFPWWHFDSLLASLRDELDSSAHAGLQAAIERNRAWSDMHSPSLVLCHGDVHPGNVIMTIDGPVLLDWDLLCHAPPGWDHAMLISLAERWGGDPLTYQCFANGYGQSLVDNPSTQRFAELRNVAATLMRVQAARHDASARDEAERRLKYWRGDTDAPMWQVQ